MVAAVFCGHQEATEPFSAQHGGWDLVEEASTEPTTLWPGHSCLVLPDIRTFLLALKAHTMIGGLTFRYFNAHL